MIFSKSQNKIILTIDTHDVGVHSFRLSPCGTYIGVVTKNCCVMVYKLNRSAETGSGGQSYVSYDLMHQLSNAVPKSAIRTENKVYINYIMLNRKA
jgi:hypothetical protein